MRILISFSGGRVRLSPGSMPAGFGTFQERW
jgi:hypothetical protein